MLTEYEIKEWMDKQIEAKRLQNIRLVVEEHDDGIDDYISNRSANDRIHIGGKAVRYIADRLRLTIYVASRPNDDKYPYELMIVYKGEMFFGIETEEEYIFGIGTEVDIERGTVI